jgi:opacity protein-like surface antigen
MTTMKRWRSVLVYLLAVPALMLAAAPADAQYVEEDGWYLGVSGGFQQRQRASEEVTAIEFSPGYSLNGLIGYRLGPVRLEGEASFLDNQANNFVFPGGVEDALGTVSLRVFSFNAYYDLPVGERIRPYVGGGLGTFQSTIKGFTSDTLAGGIEGVFPPTILNVSSLETFLWQLRAGVGTQLNDRTSMFVGYRYFHGNDLEFNAIGFGTLRPDGAKNHAGELGFRIRL